MKTPNIRRILFPCLLAAVLFLAPGLASKPGEPTNGNVFSLQVPPFVSVARAEEGSIASVIEDEAGISAYFNAAMSIDLNAVRGVFRTIEVETADYIIGSVPIPGYGEEWDAHVYVHTDGWVLAYYLAGDPVGKVFDWIAYHNGGRRNISTKLENTLAVVAGEGGVPFSGAIYYDFRYPNATHLMLIAEWIYYYGPDSFEVNLPGTFAFYQRSWSFGTTDEGWYRLDGVTIADQNCNGWCISQGTLSAAQLLPDQFHEIQVWSGFEDYAYGGLALVYRIP